jgi:putative transposase
LRRSADRLRPLIDRDHPAVSVRRQCERLGLNRSGVYYRPAAESAENLRLMALIDRQYTARPFYGSRRVTAWLRSHPAPEVRRGVHRVRVINPTRVAI